MATLHGNRPVGFEDMTVPTVNHNDIFAFSAQYNATFRTLHLEDNDLDRRHGVAPILVVPVRPLAGTLVAPILGVPAGILPRLAIGL